jgi:6-phosphogluconate dehydrogenase
MQLAMIGLGRMGGNMVRRLMGGGHQLVVYDRSPEAVQEYAGQGAKPARDLGDVCAKLQAPRVVWVMVPSGAPTQATIDDLAGRLAKGDVVIDGGNSNFHDTMRRGEALRRCEPIFKTLAPPDGYAHVGPTGAGHFVKMIHNGIEYGMLQAYAEGYEILHASKDFKLDLRRIAALWNQGSVVRSWMNELAERAFSADPDLADIRGFVEDSGEGRWTVQEAIDLSVPAPVITLALQMRFRSRQADSFGAKVVAALRKEFGGHATKKA